MKKVIVSINVTLDDFMAGPNGELDWHFPHWNEEMTAFAHDQLRSVDTILLGRVTYEAMADYWPAAAHNLESTIREIEFAEMMNNYKKIVFSTTMKTADWENTTLEKGIVAGSIQHLKRSTGAAARDIIVYGSGSIVRALARLGLVDEYRIWVHPVIIGQGRPLFQNVRHNINLRLTATKRFSSEVIILFYQPVT